MIFVKVNQNTMVFVDVHNASVTHQEVSTQSVTQSVVNAYVKLSPLGGNVDNVLTAVVIYKQIIPMAVAKVTLNIIER